MAAIIEWFRHFLYMQQRGNYQYYRKNTGKTKYAVKGKRK